MAVLAPVDRSERSKVVIEEAVRLAEAFGSEVVAMHVLTRNDFVNLERTAVEQTGDIVDIESVRETARKVAKKSASDADMQVTAIGKMGQPADEIVDYAQKNNIEYITLAPRKRSPTGKVIFGSVAQSVLLNADCSVVTTTAD